MSKYVLASSAEDDLDKIAEYTIHRWGVDQARRYGAALHAHFDALGRLAGKLKGGFAVAKFTPSGTQIIDWTPAGSEAVSRNIYPRFVAFVREAIAELTERGHAVELAGISYHLGENDMSFGPYRRRWSGSRR